MNLTTLTEEQLRTEISGKTYEELLRINRFAQATHPYLRYAEGAYFRLIMANKKAELKPEERVEISRHIGWNPKRVNQTTKNETNRI